MAITVKSSRDVCVQRPMRLHANAPARGRVVYVTRCSQESATPSRRVPQLHSRDTSSKAQNPPRSPRTGVTVDVLLNKAASSLQRGPCTCLSCRGGGTVPCQHCKASGLLDTQQTTRQHAVRTAFHRLRSAIGLTSASGPYAELDQRQSNRCLRCHGHGRLVCDTCHGSGLRFPYLTGGCQQPGADGECSLDDAPAARDQ